MPAAISAAEIVSTGVDRKVSPEQVAVRRVRRRVHNNPGELVAVDVAEAEIGGS